MIKYFFLCLFVMIIVIIANGCASSKIVSSHYYFQHEKALIAIEEKYQLLYAIKPFSIAFTDHSFNYISFEIITDSLKYIYEFELHDPRLQDTLLKYQLPVKGVTTLIAQMQAIKCIWINDLDYYTNTKKDYMVLMSIKPLLGQLPLTNKQYFILTFYTQPQYFDSEGRLLATRRLRRLRQINGEIFHRINNKVCYAVSERFR